MNCPYCDLPEDHTDECPKKERYKPPKSWKDAHAKRNISAPLDFEYSGGRRREERDRLK